MVSIRSVLLTLVSTAYAQSANPFNVPAGGYNVTAGQPVDLAWNPTTQGSVTLVLRSGASSDLVAGTVIAASIDNSGSYTWTPDSQITRGSDYTVEIVSDADPSQTNYTPYFVLESDNTVATSTSAVTLGASALPSAPASSSVSVSLSSASASVSSVLASLSSKTSATATASSTTGSSAAAASTSGASTSGSQTTQATTMSTGTASGSSSGAASATSVASASASPETASSAGAPKATVMAGMLGLAALGAFAF